MLRTIAVLFLAAATLREGPYRVERVSDGDTIAVRRGTERLVVRLIGVDAPEVSGPYRRAEPGGVEAKRALETLLRGRRIHLQMDPYQPARDRYGRTLAYVYNGQTLVNAEMISCGYARAYRQFRHTHREAFIRLEKEARAAKRGLWKNVFR